MVIVLSMEQTSRADDAVSSGRHVQIIDNVVAPLRMRGMVGRHDWFDYTPEQVRR